ncbi:hypothetical protein A0J61_11588, partial [Choanephora cucurbitarum]
SGAPRSQPRKNGQYHRWTKDGEPICGHCNKVDHLSKKCRIRRQGNSVNHVEADVVETNDPPSVNTVQTSPPTPAQYAAIPIEDDPFAQGDFAIQNITTLPENSPSVSTPRIRLTLQGHLVQALVDTGANICALRTSVANKLGLNPDSSKSAAFTIANSGHASSRGTVSIPTMLGSINTVITYHVVDSLSHPVILGYPQLKRLGAVIHTNTNTIHFSGSSGDSGSFGDFGSTRSMCTMVSSLRLPGQHHAYVDIRGPPNSAAFVSTPSDLAAEKLIGVAAGIVNFDNDGIATLVPTSIYLHRSKFLL